MVIPDHRNSVAATIDMDTHSVYRLARYTPEGLLTVLEDDGTVICAEGADLTVNCKGPDMPFGFNGMWRSEVSGLSYMPALQMRFLSGPELARKRTCNATTGTPRTSPSS